MEGSLGFCSLQGAVPNLLDFAVLVYGSDRFVHLTKACLSGHVLGQWISEPGITALSASCPQSSHSGLFAKNKSKYMLHATHPRTPG